MTNHLCFACAKQPVPVYRCFCPRCFIRIPWVLRAEVMNAYRRRVLRRSEFELKLAELKNFTKSFTSFTKDGGN